MYRINFGNGQVHGTFKSLRETKREFSVCVSDGYGRIQRYAGDGEWVTVRK